MTHSEQPEDPDRPRKNDDAEVLRAGLATMAKRAEILLRERDEARARVVELERRVIERGKV